MSAVRKCHCEDCENNYMGAYCNCTEIAIDENGCCESCFPTLGKKQSEDETDEAKAD